MSSIVYHADRPVPSGMLPWDTTNHDQQTLDALTAPDIAPLDPRIRSPSVSGDIPLSLVIQRDTDLQVLHWAVVWPAYDKVTAQTQIGYKVIEIRDNTDRAISRESPYKFRFHFKRGDSPTIESWTTHSMGNYGPDTRVGFLSAFQQWDNRGGGNCISCISDVLRYLATYGLLGNLGEEWVLNILAQERQREENVPAFRLHYEKAARAKPWAGP